MIKKSKQQSDDKKSRLVHLRASRVWATFSGGPIDRTWTRVMSVMISWCMWWQWWKDLLNAPGVIMIIMRNHVSHHRHCHAHWDHYHWLWWEVHWWRDLPLTQAAGYASPGHRSPAMTIVINWITIIGMMILMILTFFTYQFIFHAYLDKDKTEIGHYFNMFGTSNAR